MPRYGHDCWNFTMYNFSPLYTVILPIIYDMARFVYTCSTRVYLFRILSYTEWLMLYTELYWWFAYFIMMLYWVILNVYCVCVCVNCAELFRVCIIIFVLKHACCLRACTRVIVFFWYLSNYLVKGCKWLWNAFYQMNGICNILITFPSIML